ncbi:MAG: pyridoxamine 5'-phosphate oxidase family protein [Bacillota bacterium]|nr:pyridoxamine 5'-phosphate oxidase family protein [Bacillota bacterium]
MFRSIRKKKNEISTDEVKELLRCSRRGILAVNGEDGYPYAIPINYLYDEDTNKIIFHGAKAGYKVDCLKACNKVCFTVCGNERIQEESWAPFLKSAVVFGRCRLVENQEDTIKMVKKFAMKYYPDEKMADEEVASSGRAVQMFEIEIEHLSGKEVQER